MDKKQSVPSRQYTDEFKVETCGWSNRSAAPRPPNGWTFPNRACGIGLEGCAGLANSGRLQAGLLR